MTLMKKGKMAKKPTLYIYHSFEDKSSKKYNRWYDTNFLRGKYKLNDKKRTLTYIIPEWENETARGFTVSKNVPIVIHFTVKGWDKFTKALNKLKKKLRMLLRGKERVLLRKRQLSEKHLLRKRRLSERQLRGRGDLMLGSIIGGVMIMGGLGVVIYGMAIGLIANYGEMGLQFFSITGIALLFGFPLIYYGAKMIGD